MARPRRYISVPEGQPRGPLKALTFSSLASSRALTSETLTLHSYLRAPALLLTSGLRACSNGRMQAYVRPVAAPDGAADRLAQPAHTAGLIAAPVGASRLLWPLLGGTDLLTQMAP